ncbi:hypothetical protein AGMMS49982_13810 [Bacteroidia bacterium]|nr:hypothetical protein AGMMS49982_13810 [Bacteroidia bacterium]
MINLISMIIENYDYQGNHENHIKIKVQDKKLTIKKIKNYEII